ncbi:MAG: homoserine O-acetyltransferase [archaeon]|nr:homoserine O-acetyltransferase [archaeon]
MGSEIRIIHVGDFSLENKKTLSNVEVAVQTHGTLNANGDNAVLVFHALSGSAHIAGFNSEFSKTSKFWSNECRIGWWDNFVGQGKTIDTQKKFVICQNLLGGCYGTTGPCSKNPATKKPYGSSFPDFSLKDAARLQKIVLEKIGVKKLDCIIGSSLGGHVALEFALEYPDFAKKAILIGTSARITFLNRLHCLEQIFAIENDPNYCNGDYYLAEPPTKGLALARMIAHKTYVDIDAIAERARKETVLPNDYFYNYKISHFIESYMYHQGKKFTERFDANTYLAFLKAILSFDPVKSKGGPGQKIFSGLCKMDFLVVSISSDVCYYPEEQEELASQLRGAGVRCDHLAVDSGKGHDSFLLEPEKYGFINDFLEQKEFAIESQRR